MRILPVLLLVLGLQGCLQTRGQVKETEQRQVIQQQVSTLQKTNADVNNRFAEIEENMRLQNGRIEVIENKFSNAGQDRDRDRKDLQEQNAELARKVALLQESMINMEKQISQLQTEVLIATRSGNSGSATSAPTNVKKTSYDIAEEHLAKKEWKKAILNYEKYRQEYPKGKNFADATYKIGFSFQELKMRDEARTFYDEVVSKYPNSEAAKQAKAKLKNLKK